MPLSSPALEALKRLRATRQNEAFDSVVSKTRVQEDGLAEVVALEISEVAAGVGLLVLDKLTIGSGTQVLVNDQVAVDLLARLVVLAGKIEGHLSDVTGLDIQEDDVGQE